MSVQGPGWTLTPDMVSFGQVCAIPLIALGIFDWNAPAWVGDNLKRVGMIFGVYINALFILAQLFHISTGAAKFDPLGMIPTLILIALLVSVLCVELARTSNPLSDVPACPKT